MSHRCCFDANCLPPLRASGLIKRFPPAHPSRNPSRNWMVVLLELVLPEPQVELAADEGCSPRRMACNVVTAAC